MAQFVAVPLRKLIFDTSAVNRLAEDLDRYAIISALSLIHDVGVTETAISEIIATPDEAERQVLLDVLKLSMAAGHSCTMPFNWIIEEQAKAYRRDSVAYDWKLLNIRVKAAEHEIARQEFLHELSEQNRPSR